MYSQITEKKNLVKLLQFLPTAGRLHPGAVDSVNPGRDIMFTFDNPHRYAHGDVMRNVQLNYEKMRQVVLSQGYDKVWIVEEDMIPPANALEKLLEVAAPVVTGLYGLRSGKPLPNIFGGGKEGITGNVGWMYIRDHWGETVDCAGGCMGCVVLDRSVMEGFTFILDPNNPKFPHNGAPDIPLMDYCAKNGFQAKARLDVICGHCKTTGDVIWPDKEQAWRLNGLPG